MGKMTPKERADWLVDAVATATQNRMFLRGDPECDEELCLAIQLNAEKAMRLLVEAQSAEIARLREAGFRAIGSHSAPDDCYATGPLTGDAYRDLVECPACAFVAIAAKRETSS